MTYFHMLSDPQMNYTLNLRIFTIFHPGVFTIMHPPFS